MFKSIFGEDFPIKVVGLQVEPEDIRKQNGLNVEWFTPECVEEMRNAVKSELGFDDDDECDDGFTYWDGGDEPVPVKEDPCERCAKRDSFSLEPIHIYKNGNTTTVIWDNGEHTEVTLGPDQKDNPYTAFAYALAKYMYGSTSTVCSLVDNTHHDILAAKEEEARKARAEEERNNSMANMQKSLEKEQRRSQEEEDRRQRHVERRAMSMAEDRLAEELSQEYYKLLKERVNSGEKVLLPKTHLYDDWSF